jgi:hypothetical protein
VGTPKDTAAFAPLRIIRADLIHEKDVLCARISQRNTIRQPRHDADGDSREIRLTAAGFSGRMESRQIDACNVQPDLSDLSSKPIGEVFPNRMRNYPVVADRRSGIVSECANYAAAAGRPSKPGKPQSLQAETRPSLSGHPPIRSRSMGEILRAPFSRYHLDAVSPDAWSPTPLRRLTDRRID